MEALGAVAMKFKNEEEEEKVGPFGFNKKVKEGEEVTAE